MTIQEDTVALHLVAAQTLALMDAIIEATAAQVEATAGATERGFNSNFYISRELHRRLVYAQSYNSVAVMQTVKRLEELGMTGAEAPPALSLTPYGILERVSGFSSYREPAGVQDIPANINTPVENAATTITEAEKPADVVTFYDGNRFRGNLGDALLLRITFDAEATSAETTATELSIWLDYGETGIKLFDQIRPLTLGYGEVQPITYLVPLFVGPQFADTGGRLMVRADGPVQISNPHYMISRLHKSYL